MSLLYCPKCGKHLEGGDGECRDCSCGWTQPVESFDHNDEIQSLRAELAKTRQERDELAEMAADYKQEWDDALSHVRKLESFFEAQANRFSDLQAKYEETCKELGAMKLAPRDGIYPWAAILEPTAHHAQFWLDGARREPVAGTALLCAEQAVNSWKNAAYHYCEELAALQALLAELREDLTDANLNISFFELEEDSKPSDNGIHLYPEQRAPSLERIYEWAKKVKQALSRATSVETLDRVTAPIQDRVKKLEKALAAYVEWHRSQEMESDDPPRTFGCNHIAETCTLCERSVKRWKMFKAAQQALLPLP